MAIEIVDFPIKDGGSFHSFLYVYQRVALMWYLGVSENGVRCDTVHPNWLACCEHAGDGPMMGMDVRRKTWWVIWFTMFTLW